MFEQAYRYGSNLDRVCIYFASDLDPIWTRYRPDIDPITELTAGTLKNGIYIWARDDVQVARVQVAVLDEEG